MPTPRPRALRPPGRGPGVAALLLTLRIAAPAAASAPVTPPATSPATTPPVTTSPVSASEPVTSPVSASEPVTPPATSPVTTPPVTTPPAAPPVTEARIPATRPPRVDGPYIGLTVGPSGSFARVNAFETPNPLMGTAGSLRFGEAILPWMTIGVEIAGTLAYRSADPRQRLLQGAVLIDFGFLPIKRVPLSLHVGFGAGGGAVREAGRSARSGFGGAVFTGAVRYEIFPLADRKRANRGGGFSLGPELGWLGFTPAARGRPMSNTIYLGLFVGFYFGS